MADGLAKAALTSSLAAISLLCWSDLKPRVDMYINKIWQELWNSEAGKKLYEVLPDLKESLCGTAGALCLKQESVMARLRIGHTWITHSYLLKKEDQPVCHACDSPFTVKQNAQILLISEISSIQQLMSTPFSERLVPRGSLNTSKKLEFITRYKLWYTGICTYTRFSNIHALLYLYKHTPLVIFSKIFTCF